MKFEFRVVSPFLHESIVDGDNKDLPGTLEFVTGDVAGDVGIGACWRKGGGDTYDETFARAELLGEVDLVPGGVLKQVDVRDGVALFDLGKPELVN